LSSGYFRMFGELYIGKIRIKTVNLLYFHSVNKMCECDDKSHEPYQME
jgi:hypothetical protein